MNHHMQAALDALPPVTRPQCGSRKGFPDTCADNLAMSRTAVLVMTSATAAPPPTCCCPCPPDDVQ